MEACPRFNTPGFLLCPVCQEGLHQTGRTLQCCRGHSYDIAKEGYVNLLLANQKASSAPGDTKEMAVSRRFFLDQGHYDPLSDQINAILGGRADAVLDAGCGEGYYLNRLKETLPLNADTYGLDISKEAIKLAAAQYKQINFLVASLHQSLPFADASFDIILNVFAPRNPAEFARVLRPGGRALVVVPAEGHLAALHQALGLAQIEDGKHLRTALDFEGALSVSHTAALRYQRLLRQEDLTHLIQMMPAVWHLSDESRANANALGSLEIEFAFTLIELHRAFE